MTELTMTSQKLTTMNVCRHDLNLTTPKRLIEEIGFFFHFVTIE